MPACDKACRVLHDEGYHTMTWSDGPGTIYSDHQHDHDECLWVLGGRMDFTIGGIVYSVGAGDRLRLRRGTVHAARVVGNETCYYLIGQR